jgi:AcrR family transcriptional regulator
MRHFAERGYQAARVEDIASELGIAKGSIFQHFKTKDGLFLTAYVRAASKLPAYLDAPVSVVRKGFFATLHYWLTRTGRLLHEDWIPYRVTLLGNYGSHLRLRREINRFLVEEDPYGTNALVRGGIERKEVRDDVPTEMIVSLVDWMMGSFQDALLTEELDPGLFRRHAGEPERAAARIDQFMKLLRSAIGRGRAATRR